MVPLVPNDSQNSSPSPELGAGSSTASTEKKHAAKLSTSSPEAIRVASAITPHRLANLLIRNGPLAIRLITSQLSAEVPGFELLSLSKQRRLIMAAMEQGDPENNVVFEKIGWGQWAVRHVDSDYIVTEPNGSMNGDARLSIHEIKEKAKLGWSKKTESVSIDSPTSSHNDDNIKSASRRDSISNNKSNMHNFRLPGENLESAPNAISESDQESDEGEDLHSRPVGLGSLTSARDLNMKFKNDEDDNAIEEDSEEDAMEEDDALFKFEEDDHNPAASNKFKRSPPLKFANRVPTKFSPPPALGGGRRKSSSAMAPNSIVKNTSHRHQFLSRSRLNSMENLDEYILSSARNSSLSVSSPTMHNSSLPSTSPLGSWSGKGEYLSQHELNLPVDHLASALQNAGRRKSSFNESSIRSTLSSSLPRGQPAAQRPYENGTNSASSTVFRSTKPRKHAGAHDMASDTDEEDWATMGAETLRSHSVGVSSPAEKKTHNEEASAARALVDLMGI